MSIATINNAALPPMQFYDSPSSSPHLPGLSLPSAATNTARDPSQLSMIAASASNLEAMLPNAAFPMEPDPGVPNAGGSDKFFHPQVPRSVSTWPLSQGLQTDAVLHEGSQDSHTASIEAITSRAATFPRPIAMNPNGPHRGYTTDFNTSNRPSRPKVRGRFTPSRRKEVQEVRKRGACLRCRMLKKPVLSCTIKPFRGLFIDYSAVFWWQSLQYLRQCRECASLETTMHSNSDSR